MSAAAAAAAPSLDQVVAVVINYNAGDHLVRCLASLRAAGVTQRIVVDNASSDGSRAAATAADPDHRWIDAGGNIGYGRGANLGAAAVPGAWVLVCNPDLVLAPDAPAALLQRLVSEPGLGLVGPRILNLDETTYPSARTFPNLVDAIGHGVLGLVAPRNRFTRNYRLLDWDHEQARVVDWVSGACFLARREAWDAVGGFDPSYFMYLEDVDLCWRLGRGGWGVGFDPAAVVTHVQGVSAGLRPYRMLAAHHRSLWRFAYRTTTGWRRLLLPVVGLGLVGRLGAASVQHRLAGENRRGRSVPAPTHPVGTDPPRQVP